MRFSIIQLLLVIALFGLFLAIRFPWSLVVPDGIWTVVSIDEKQEKDWIESWPPYRPVNGHVPEAKPIGLFAEIKSGREVRTVFLGNVRQLEEHQLEVPKVGSSIVLNDKGILGHSVQGHSVLPVAPIAAISKLRIVAAACLSLLSSIFIVAGCLAVRRAVARQIFLYRERRMIDGW